MVQLFIGLKEQRFKINVLYRVFLKMFNPTKPLTIFIVVYPNMFDLSEKHKFLISKISVKSLPTLPYTSHQKGFTDFLTGKFL